MAKANTSHDISITNNAGREVGYMLATDKSGFKSYMRYDDPTFPNQFFTGAPDYGYLPPEKEVAIIQNSFDGGFGLEFADSADSKRYYYGIGVDNRFKGNTILGPKPTAIALPTTYTKTPPEITNGGFEEGGSGNPPTGWTVSAGTAVLGTAFAGAHSGSYAVTITPAGSDVIIYQDLAWDDELQGTPVRAEVWFSGGTSGQTRGQIIIDDGVGTTTASQTTFTTAYTKTTVTRTLDASATRLRIIIKGDYIASNVALFADDCVVYVSHIDQPVASIETSDGLYFAMGSCVYKLNGTGDGWTLVGSVYYPITGLMKVDYQAVYSGTIVTYIFVCTGSQQYYWYFDTTTETFTESTIADGQAEFMLNVSGVYYKVVLPNEVKKSTDPRNAGSWSAASDIGAYEDDITAVAVDVDIPYFAKPDTVYYLDTTDAAYPLISDMQSIRSTANGVNMVVWHRKLYVPCGTQGLVEYSNGAVTWRSPSKFCTNLNYFTGSVQALAADEEYLYAIVDNGTKVEVLAGQERVVDGAAVWAWHTIQEITLAGCQYAVVSSTYKKRLWIASTSSSDSVYWIPITTRYGDIANDSNYTYLTGGYDITPWYHLNLRADSKAYLSMTLSTEGCDTNNYVNVYYQTYYTALTGSWTLLGKFDTSPTETISLAASAPTGTMIRFKRVLVTNSTGTSPRITGMDCRGIWRPDKRKMIQCAVQIKDNPILRNGATGDETAATLAATIEEQNDATSPTTYYDIDGTSYKVALLNATKQNVRLPKDRNPEYEYLLTMQVLA